MAVDEVGKPQHQICKNGKNQKESEAIKVKRESIWLLILLGYCNSSATMDWEDISPLANVYLSASVVTDIFIGYSG